MPATSLSFSSRGLSREVPNPELDDRVPSDGGEAVAVLAGGGFWCVEAVYKQLGGRFTPATREAPGRPPTTTWVSSGRTGHAEAVEIRFDPEKLSYGQLLKVFFSIAHDPDDARSSGQRRR
jgi:peptide-methionine (S)-S-oxide reductase